MAKGRKQMNAEEKGQTQAIENGTLKHEALRHEAIGDVVIRDKSRQKKIWFMLAGVTAVLLVIILVGIFVFSNNERKLQKRLDLGTKYLEEMDYEQALVAFDEALSIDPNNVDAYLGIVEVYIRTNEFETALEYAQEGYEVTGDERLKEKADMIESGDIFASNGWIMKMSSYDGEGNLIFWHEFTYNLKGQKASVAKYDAQGVQKQYLELEYDEEGRELVRYSFDMLEGDLIKVVREYSGSNYRETAYEGTSDVVNGYTDVEVDSDGNTLKEIDYGKDGSVGRVTVYEYDKEGRRIKVSSYNSNNELIDYYVWIYDENSVQARFYDSDGILEDYIEYIYDEAGNELGKYWYNADGTLISEMVNQ